MRGARAVLLVLVLVFLSCSYAKGPPYVVDGRRFRDDQVESVREGMTASEVRGLLGEPVEIERQQGREQWIYFVWQKQDETVRYLGFIPKKRLLYSGTKKATILIKDGFVEDVQFRHRRFE